MAIFDKCLFKNNLCYQYNSPITPIGIILHSTGADNPNLNRVVAPCTDDSNYDSIIADIGVNLYNNDWNRARPDGQKKCVHAFIGKNKKGVVKGYQVLPYNIECWGAGKPANQHYIQVEVMESYSTSPEYLLSALRVFVPWAVSLCLKYDINPDNIISHKEAHKKGIATNHADIDHWLVKFGYSMEMIRSWVKSYMCSSPIDVDGDGKLTLRDGTLLLRKLAGHKGIKDVDLNGDGKTTPVDGTILLRILADWKTVYPRLKKGDTGNFVSLLQTFLNHHGWNIAIDSSFGPKTEKAVNEFKLFYNIEENGVDTETWSRLIKR